jgi:topoisomerase IA-like protein
VNKIIAAFKARGTTPKKATRKKAPAAKKTPAKKTPAKKARAVASQGECRFSSHTAAPPNSAPRP